jgi:DNA-binding transcriptional ArsR family regulator
MARPKKKKAAQKMNPEALEALAETFRLLSESGRLALLQELKEGERMVGELVELTGMAQAGVSKHLKVLHDGGLIARRKEGVRVYYSLEGDFVLMLCRMVCDRLTEQQRDRTEIEFMI